MKLSGLRYHHLGMPAKCPGQGAEYLPEYKVYHWGFPSDEFGIEWMYYEDECKLPEIVKSQPHIAFEVDNVHEWIKGRKVIIQPNSPSPGTIVAFIEHEGLPIELIQVDNTEEDSIGP